VEKVGLVVLQHITCHHNEVGK